MKYAAASNILYHKNDVSTHRKKWSTRHDIPILFSIKITWRIKYDLHKLFTEPNTVQ
jgi:hypothetical protein